MYWTYTQNFVLFTIISELDSQERELKIWWNIHNIAKKCLRIMLFAQLIIAIILMSLMIRCHIEGDRECREYILNEESWLSGFQRPIFINCEGVRNSNNVTNSIFLFVKEPICLLSQDYQTALS